MKQYAEIPYWIAMAHLPKWWTARINYLIIKIIHENQSSLETFFNLSKSEWKTQFALTEKEVRDLLAAKKELPNISFLTEDLISQGFEIIPINSIEYSKILKQNLKATHSPPILYVKGNKQILQENSLAIVGNRKANNISLQFTDNIAKLAVEQRKIVVSGFAKGVDKQALDSTLKYKGKSIIVLPQGVLTFGSGIKRYYKQIVAGDVLVVSTFHPKAPWSVSLAMARNPIIYGFAKETYVAQSDSKGGTYAGVMNGLKKSRTIFVRYPEQGEKNANLQLIEKGAIPVNLTGIMIKHLAEKVVEKQGIESEKIENIEDKILSILSQGIFTSKEIVEKTKIDWSSRQVTYFLKSHQAVETINKKPLRFKKRGHHPEQDEKNANVQFTEKELIPVNFAVTSVKQMTEKVVEKQAVENVKVENIEAKILSILSQGIFTSKEIVEKTKIDWSSRKMTLFLKSHQDVETINKKPLRFKKRNSQSIQADIFNFN